LQSALILLGVSLITFVLLFLLPADPATVIAGRSASPEVLQSIREQLGLDKPFFVQYLRYLQGLLHGDLGRSYIERASVTSLILPRLPASLLLMAAGIVCELLIGLTLGILSALRRNSKLDQFFMVISFIGVSTPQFVSGLLLLYVFAIQLGWFPIGGYGSFSNLVLPGITLGIMGGGWYSRMMRSSMIEVLTTDFIRTARAKGLRRKIVVFRHAVPNALLPVIAMVGIDIGLLMGSIVVVESVFGWPGIGQLAWQAVQRVDTPLIMGVTLFLSLAVVLGNLMADLVAPLIDPRIKNEKT